MALKPIAQVVRELSQNDLRTAYQELYDWKYKTSVLVDGVVRKAHLRLEELTNSEHDLRTVESEILFEIARRYVDITR